MSPKLEHMGRWGGIGSSCEKSPLVLMIFLLIHIQTEEQGPVDMPGSLVDSGLLPGLFACSGNPALPLAHSGYQCCACFIE